MTDLSSIVKPLEWIQHTANGGYCADDPLLPIIWTADDETAKVRYENDRAARILAAIDAPAVQAMIDAAVAEKLTRLAEQQDKAAEKWLAEADKRKSVKNREIACARAAGHYSAGKAILSAIRGTAP